MKTRTIRRFNNKKTFAGRTVKRTVLENRGLYKKRPARKLRTIRSTRSR